MIIATYRPDIDGLRAVAILPVVFYHAAAGFSGGFVGVDVFFVISGYLITSLITRDLSENRFSLWEFWHRRVRRIFPALFAMVATTLIAGALLMIPADYKELGQSALAQCFFSSNIFFWDDVGYFATAAESKPLLHTWSLAVEEQFYLLFPIILTVAWRKCKLRVGHVLFLLFAGSLIASLFGPRFFPNAAFFLLPTRAWELLLGSILVYVPHAQASRSGAKHAISSFLGLLLILVPALFYTSKTAFPGFAAIPPCLGAALIIWGGIHRPTLVHRWLSFTPIVFIGKISYSLYLWHWPVLLFSKKFTNGPASLSFTTFQLFVSGFFAVISWLYVETPFREKRWLASRDSIFRFGIICTVTIAAFSATVSATKGLPQRLPKAVRKLTEDPPGLSYDQNVGITTEELNSDLVPKLGIPDHKNAHFVLWGDSHAMASSPVFDVLAREYHQWGYVVSRVGTMPLLNTWKASGDKSSVAFNQAAIDFIRRHRIKVVFLASYWALHVGVGDGSKEWLITDDETLPITPANTLISFRRQLNNTLDALHAIGTRVYILRQVPQQDIHVPDVFTTRMLLRQSIQGMGATAESHAKLQRNVNTVFDALIPGSVSFLDPSPWLLGDDSKYVLIRNGRVTYDDSGHLSVEGSMMLLDMLRPAFANTPDSDRFIQVPPK
ncbi:MAG: acyltransferase family protein [Fimbriimonadaceae bacterium]